MGHSMIQTCERIVDRTTGSVERYFLSNAPIGYYCYAYPPALQQQQEDEEEQVIAQLTARVAELELQLESNLFI